MPNVAVIAIGWRRQRWWPPRNSRRLMYTLSYKTVLKSLRNSKWKLVIITNNCPPHCMYGIECYAMLVKVGVHHYNETNVDLGTVYVETVLKFAASVFVWENPSHPDTSSLKA
ncbi:hypothetical protein Dsin_022306 [Dipteronia sinensis]|uniref:Ribosomal protein eL8/eL30/eS12/Gadd45 domain-containing protein n=1 Tax=Dipteronia sinensis TaxID=43782 RepID=A0AAE0A2R2_9ROSI|nr:hypothetical protein Dsin_022306 [Dipteronia sinensis]